MSIQVGESYRFEQEVVFDGHQYSFSSFGGECQITRGSDGYYWDGAAFVIANTWNATTVDTSNEFHYYDWSVPITANDGDTYSMRIRLLDDPDTEAGGTMIVREEGSGGGGDVFIYPINVFDD